MIELFALNSCKNRIFNYWRKIDIILILCCQDKIFYIVLLDLWGSLLSLTWKKKKSHEDILELQILHHTNSDSYNSLLFKALKTIYQCMQLWRSWARCFRSTIVFPKANYWNLKDNVFYIYGEEMVINILWYLVV